MRVTVIGAGSWGTALARLLAMKEQAVTLWVYEKEVAAGIQKTRENKRYLPGARLPPSLAVSTRIEQALSKAQFVLFAVPSHAARTVFLEMRPFLPAETPLIIATKGIERKTLLLMSEVALDALDRKSTERLAILSGPSFAQEVVAEHPTAVSLAAGNPRLALRIQTLFSTPMFRLFLSSDLIGVQLGGALKNVIALAAGGSDGLGFGFNTKSVLMTRGLAEITRLGMAMGAEVATFYGLSGMGDLFLTCGGGLSRNRHVGEALGQGQALDDILKGMNAVAEGVYTTEAAFALSQKYQVDMPIIREIYAVLFKGKSPKEAVLSLMKMARGSEIHLAVKRVKAKSAPKARSPLP